MTLHVGVFGHYGNGNLGDEAITEACVDSARRLLGATQVSLFSIVPEDSAQRHDLNAYPIRRDGEPVAAGTPWTRPTPPAHTTTEPLQRDGGLRGLLKRSAVIRGAVNFARGALSAPARWRDERRFLRDSAAVLQDVDLLIVAGSNQYLDNFGGVWGFPYTLMKWADLCQRTNTAIVFLSIGAGPIDHPLSRFMVRRAIRKSLFHSYRDEGSLRLIEGPNARLGGVVYPDLACNLRFDVSNQDYTAERLRVAINPMPVYGDYWFVQDRAKYIDYLTRLAELALYLDGKGCAVTLFPTQTRDMDAIRDMVEIVRERDAAVAQRIAVNDTATTQEVMQVIQAAHVIVPTRFHGTILGILAKRLVLGVCYQAKAMEAMQASGQGDYAFMLDDVSAAQLCAAFDGLVEDKQAALEQISTRSEEVRAAIDEQYAQVLTRYRAR